jgi:predicted nucleic acid-binding protein
MSGKVFIDTNILIYAHDLDAREKPTIAATILRNLWETETGIVSVQVLQEFHVNVTRKIPNPLPKPKAREIIQSYQSWHVELNDIRTIFAVSEFEERYNPSFWDALIVAAACNAKVEKILTKDLNHGQRIEGVFIENPFSSA